MHSFSAPLPSSLYLLLPPSSLSLHPSLPSISQLISHLNLVSGWSTRQTRPSEVLQLTKDGPKKIFIRLWSLTMWLMICMWRVNERNSGRLGGADRRAKWNGKAGRPEGWITPRGRSSRERQGLNGLLRSTTTDVLWTEIALLTDYVPYQRAKSTRPIVESLSHFSNRKCR